MSPFYTSVNRYGNNILLRGIHNGRRIAKKVAFQPTLYIPAQKDSEWKTLEGYPVDPRTFASMKDAGEFIRTYENVENFTVYGNTNYVTQFITEFYGQQIDFDRDAVNVTSIDIEVASDAGFPHPDQAEHPIISIALKNNIDNLYHVWGLGEYDPSKCEIETIDPTKIRYYKFDDETELLLNFLHFWFDDKNTPDIVTGWNIRMFDLPYIINRLKRLIGGDVWKKISPWQVIEARTIVMAKKEISVYDIMGIQQLDYYDLFQKFGYSYGQQESYKLDHIAHVVLGENKLSYDEYGNLYTLYKENHQKFIDYNIRDTQLVERLDEKMGLIMLAMVMAYRAGVNYSETFGTTSIWDAIIYRHLHAKKVVVPPKKMQSKMEFPGAYVKPPVPGLYKWVVSFDLNSLYPLTIVQYNMSIETLIPGKLAGVSVDALLNREIDFERIALRDPNLPADGYTVTATGTRFRRDKQGVVPTIISAYYAERAAVKKQMLAAKQEYEHNPSRKLENKINTLENQQMAIKILMNSLYGAMGNNFFRYFDVRIAEGITQCGQLAIRWAETAINKMMNKILETTNQDYVIAIDTDSLYINMEKVVKKFHPDDTVKFLDKICAEHFEKILEKAYAELATAVNAFENRMVMKREVIADKGVWVAKKHYILHVHNSEGVQYAEPKLKMMGIEAVKSSTPQVCRDKFKQVFKIMVTKDEADLQEFVTKFRQEFKQLPAEAVAFPRGVSDIDKSADPRTIYGKGTPYHVRGSLLYNHNIKRLGLQNRYELIQNGEKIKFVALRIPNPIQENVIAFPLILPKEFNLHQYVDYETQFNKSFVEPLKTFTDAIGWSIEPRATLDEFFA